jgi:flagellin
MRKQIRGLTQASANAEDGISAVQTAEGALSEVQDMLQRMNELAVKSANGTNSESDRSYIQSEIDQLTTEIDRVAQTTKFNETYLLKGDNSLDKSYSFSYGVPTNNTSAQASVEFNWDSANSSASADANLDVTVSVVSYGTVKNDTMNELLKSFRDQGISITTSTVDDGASGTKQVSTLQLNGDAASNYNVVTLDQGVATAGTDLYSIQDLEGNEVMQLSIAMGGNGIDGSLTVLADKDTLVAQRSITEQSVFYDADGNAVAANALGNYFAADAAGTAALARAEGSKLYDAVGTEIDKATYAEDVHVTKDLTAALNIKFQVGADTSSANKISVNIDAMSAKGLGINGLKVDGTDSTNADSAVNTISEAIQKVSKQRSTLGAVQNRLEHTINNLDNVVENTTSAESAIRDTDMATEMVTYSNANILAQAGQAMLAQSNQSNQGVLSLLG